MNEEEMQSFIEFLKRIVGQMTVLDLAVRILVSEKDESERDRFFELLSRAYPSDRIADFGFGTKGEMVEELERFKTRMNDLLDKS